MDHHNVSENFHARKLKTMNIFEYILQGHEATLDNAVSAANNLDWSGVGTYYRETPYLHSDFIVCVNGVRIFYDYGADYYYFVDEVDTPEIVEDYEPS